MELKKINIEQRSFVANGKTYHIEVGDISIARWAKYEELMLELQYGTTQAEMFKNWKRVTELANELKFSDIAILANNMQNGIHKIMERIPVGLRISTLFINEEKEDRGVINDDMISAKIEDWQKEGYAIGPFFQLALVFSGLTKESSNSLSPESLAHLEELNQRMIGTD